MAVLTLRLTKGSPLTNLEIDNNFSNINSEIGVLNLLSTTANSNLVVAINETAVRVSSISNTAPINAVTTGTIEKTVAISHQLSGVGAGSYGNATSVPSFVVNEFGHITSASNISIVGGVSSVAGAQGDISNTQIVSGFTTAISPGTEGNVLTSVGGSWVSNLLPVSSVSNTSPINVVNNLGAVSFSHATSGVAASTYGGSNGIMPIVAVNPTGHVTFAANTSVLNSASNTTPINLTITSGTAAISHADSGVTANTYGGTTNIPVFTVNSAGHVTSASNVAIVAGATITDTTTINASTFYIGMANNQTSGAWTDAYVSSTKLYFNPSTGTLNSTAFNTLSDAKYKDNISVIYNATEIVKRLNGVSFNWKENGHKSYGIIAQELENVLPELINDDGNRKTVNYSGLIAFLINAVKELDARVNKLESK